MALVTRSSNFDADATSAIKKGVALPQPAGNPLVAGEDLDAGAPCHIQSSDGKIYMSNATSDNEAAEIVGFTPKSYNAGQVVTLYQQGAVFYYADDFNGDDSISPGDILYIAATDGRLDDSTTTGDSTGVARVIDNNHIQVIRDS